jgi:pimeloyl-ACP methyl ester carboxylesterase
MEPRSRRLPGSDGLGIHVLEWSEAGTPLLLVHGFGNEAHIWDDFAPIVAPHYRTVAVDLRGHGDSDHDPERRYDYDHHVADLEAVSAALGIERLVLVGHSFGGRTGVLFAAKHPERMAGLVIVDIGPEHDPRGTTRIRMEVMQRGDGSFASPAEYERVLAHNFPAGSESALRRMAQHELPARGQRFERKADPARMGPPGPGSGGRRARAIPRSACGTRSRASHARRSWCAGRRATSSRPRSPTAWSMTFSHRTTSNAALSNGSASPDAAHIAARRCHSGNKLTKSSARGSTPMRVPSESK